MNNQDNEKPKKYVLATLSREALEELCAHLLQADRAREAIDAALVQKLGLSRGDAHEIFSEWCAVHKELSENSDFEISRIFAGIAPSSLQN